MGLILSFFGTVDEIWFIEILWMSISAIGLSFSLYNFMQTRLDYKAIQESGIANGRRLLARTALWSEGLRSIIQGLFLFVGIWAVLFIPKSAQRSLPLKYEIYSYASRYIFVTAALLLMINTVIAWYTRHRIILAAQKLTIILDSEHPETDVPIQTVSTTPDQEH